MALMEPVAAAPNLLANSLFRRLWIAQFSTVVFVYSLSLAGAVLIEEQTHSSTQIGLMILASLLPAFLGSLSAGVVVDRWGRIRSLVVSHGVRGLVGVLFCLGTWLLPVNLAVKSVYAASVINAIFSQFALTAELTLVPDLVERSCLPSANALLQLGMLAGEGVGIAFLSPFLIKWAGLPAVGGLGAGLCLLAFGLILSLPNDRGSPGQPHQQASVWHDVREGWQVLIQDRLLTWVAVQAVLAATLLLVLLSLIPGLVSRHLGMNVEDAPFLILPGGLGFVLGSFVISRWSERLGRPAWITLGFVGLGGNLGLLSLLSSPESRLWIIPLPIVGIGLALSLIIIPARTVLQERPPAPLRGRVIAAQLAVANAAAVLPLLAGGVLADRLGIRPVMALLSLFAVGTGAVGWHRLKS